MQDAEARATITCHCHLTLELLMGKHSDAIILLHVVAPIYPTMQAVTANGPVVKPASSKISSPSLCCPMVFPPSTEWDVKHKNALASASAAARCDENLCSSSSLAQEHDAQHSLYHHNERKCLFNTLPDELLRIVITWMDIPCLALLIRTSKSSTIANMAADDKTWLSLVGKRFNIATNRSTSAGLPRSKSYGGSTWKAAYRSMALAKRLPKCRQMPRKNVVFCKGSNVNSCPSVNMWVMMNHTDDCNTREVPREREITNMNNENPDDSSSTSSSSDDDTPRERYVELRICVQNIRSGFRTVQVDIENTTVSIVGMRGISVTGVQQPRIVYKSSEDKKAAEASGSSKRTRYNASRRRSARRSYLLINSDDDETPSDEVSPPIARHATLKPFEFVVFTARVPCTFEMRYETDFLSRARSVDVPVSWTPAKPNSSNALTKDFDSCYSEFISEFEIWEHYMELPGNCLTLVDRSHVMSA